MEISPGVANVPVNRSDGAPGRWEMSIYASGEVASNLSWNMVTGFLLFYYTDVAFIPVSALAAMFLITKIADAFIDIGAGTLVDRTRSRWGHARPFILFGALPFGLLCTAVFWVPDATVNVKIVYAYVTFALLGLFYSLIYVPYAALQSLLTADTKSHVLMGGLRSAGTSIASIIVYALVQPTVKLFGGGQTGFGRTAALFSAFSVILYLNVFFGTRERAKPHATAAPLRVSLRRVISNKVWLGAFILMLINFSRVISLVSVLPYFSKVVLGNAALLGLFLSVQSGAVLIGSTCAAPLMTKLGIARANIAAVLLSCAMFGLMFLAGTNLYVLLPLFAIASFPIGLFNSASFASCSLAAQLQFERYGAYNEGLLSSGISFSQKVGAAFGTAIVALSLTEAHYTPGATTSAVTNAIKLIFFGLQIILLLLHIPAITLLDPSPLKR